MHLGPSSTSTHPKNPPEISRKDSLEQEALGEHGEEDGEAPQHREHGQAAGEGRAVRGAQNTRAAPTRAAHPPQSPQPQGGDTGDAPQQPHASEDTAWEEGSVRTSASWC